MSDAAPPTETLEDPPRSTPRGPSAIDQLRAIAGAPPGAKTFVIRGENGDIHVSYSSALAHGIEMRVPFPEWRGGGGGAYRGQRRAVVAVKRPMTIYLRKEVASDLHYKAAGINREVQTGDAAFDAEVYVNALYDEDAHVHAVLAHEDARRAAVALLREEPTVFLLDDEDGSVLFHLVISHDDPSDADRGRRIVTALDQLVGALPQLQTTGADGRLVRGWMILLTWAALLVPGGVLFFTMRPPQCSPREGDLVLSCAGGAECCEPIWGGLAGGAALALALGLLVWKTVRGRSNSSTKQRFWMVLTTGVSLEVGVIVARLLW